MDPIISTLTFNCLLTNITGDLFIFPSTKYPGHVRVKVSWGFIRLLHTRRSTATTKTTSTTTTSHGMDQGGTTYHFSTTAPFRPLSTTHVRPLLDH
jgi:hypothetical protein